MFNCIILYTYTVDNINKHYLIYNFQFNIYHVSLRTEVATLKTALNAVFTISELCTL